MNSHNCVHEIETFVRDSQKCENTKKSDSAT